MFGVVFCQILVYNQNHIILLTIEGNTMNEIKQNLDSYFAGTNDTNKVKTKEVSEWIHRQRKYDAISDRNSKRRNGKGEHPITILKQYVYVIDYGSTVGMEFKDLHLGLVIQNDKGNLYSDTVIVLPITDFKDNEKYDPNVHHKICNSYFENVDKRGLDKDPSKVKIADITTVDKSRIGNRIGKLNNKTYGLIMGKLKKILNIC